MENELIETENNALPANAEVARAVQEVQAQVVMAKKFPRAIGKVHDEIMEACKITSLAKEAEYCLPISGRSITGPSVRIAEVILQCFGNAEMGTRLLESHNGYGIYESFFMDYEKNIRKTVKYKIEYTRYSKANGHKKLEDASDIKRAVNRISALHERDCLFKCVPKYLVDDALKECRKTIAEKGGTLSDRIRNMVNAFASLTTGKVTREDLEARLGHTVDEMNLEQVLEYGRIYNSLNEGASRKADWFKSAQRESEDLSDVNAPLDLAATKEPKNSSKKDAEPKTEQKQEDAATTKQAGSKEE